MYIKKLIKIVHFLGRNNSSVKELYSKIIKFLLDEINEYETPFRPNVEIYSHDEQSRVYCEFITNGRDFHHGRSRFSWWKVEIFIMIGRDFPHDGQRSSSWQVEVFFMSGRDFHHGKSRFSSWKVQIFILTAPDFHHARSRFSSRQVQIFFMKGLDFHQDRSRFSLLIVSAKIPERERSVLPSSFYVKLPDY